MIICRNFFVCLFILIGLEFSFATECGGVVDTKSGTLPPPNHTQNTNFCSWDIIADSDERIELTIKNLTIKHSDRCNSGYVEVKHFSSSDFPRGKFCGDVYPDKIRSAGNTMSVSYYLEDLEGDQGFEATYETICGRDIYLFNEDTIGYQMMPQKNSTGKKCMWKITVPPMDQIGLNFDSFNMDCVNGHVEVREGLSEDGNIIGVFCGKERPNPIISKSGYLWIKFELIKPSEVNGGFTATITRKSRRNSCLFQAYKCSQRCLDRTQGYECSCTFGYKLAPNGYNCIPVCGSTINGTNGTISSLDFPVSYDPNLSCVWEITINVAHDEIPFLQFTHFDLEGTNPLTGKCEYDSLTIESLLAENNWKPEGEFCGNKVSEIILPKSNIVRVNFSTDSTFERTGFVLRFGTEFDRCSVNNGNCRYGCLNTHESYRCNCLHHLDDSGHDCRNGLSYEISSLSGTFTSPNYPDLFPSDKTSEWFFTTTPGHRIQISFNSYEMGASTDEECTTYFLKFFEGHSSSNKEVGKYCQPGSIPPIISSSNEFYVLFKMANLRYKGFEAAYSSICGGALEADTSEKYIYSHPDFGSSIYDNKLDCKWNITSGVADHKIKISFPDFKVEEFTGCSYDFVEVYNGSSKDSKSLGKFCGDKKPESLLEDNFVIHFQSDGTKGDKGFIIKYQAVPATVG